ncbi:K(+)-transporting ATPase subunit C [Amycolatopsis rhizosphaerae]|uniref:Potassium-transporting ATPase KdpC subunit n=1 Tax=Amycolatopsis rhizosphaerae TaxID=2053003 RepID=A0A558BFL6_9PSEU|nr:K(+)-transporting ATPase subunit C [Amycolatopsis rhizosphaerae]TVT35306.1 K(+)-transporting ATPase subunit C [Amycolatopsis rhizosphaerae]
MKWFSAALRQAGAGLRLLLALTVLTGVVYPLAVWGVSRLPGLHDRAEGSIVSVDGQAVGSREIGVDLTASDPAHDPWFHTRPSALAADPLGPGDPSTSGGSNLAADNPKLAELVRERKTAIAAREGVSPDRVPADAVTASASGLDPDISPAYAYLQVPRVARVNGLTEQQVRRIVDERVRGRALGVLGEPAVGVLDLNLAVHRLTHP